MASFYGRSPWLDDEVHEAVGRLTVILDTEVKDALIVLRDLAGQAHVSLVEAARTVNGGGLEALRALAKTPARKLRRATGPPRQPHTFDGHRER